MFKVSATSTHDQKSLIWNFKVSKYYFLARSEKMPLSWVRETLVSSSEQCSFI